MARQRRSSSTTRPRVQPHQFALLIDENLTPDLVKLARRRGFSARHVNDVNLRTATDKAVARENQATLLGIALKDILAHDLLQEVVLVRLISEDAGGIEHELTRHELPKH